MNCKLAAALAVFVQVTGWGQSACDRACLENFVDQYIDALIAHDPKKLPMTARVKNTEDGVQLVPGDGFWRSALGKGSYRLFVTDTESGQIAFMGTMREDPNNLVIIALRLKVENRQVSEIENVVVREAPAGANLEKLGSPNPIFTATIPAAQRASRAELVRTGNLYLSTLEKNDGKAEAPFAADCVRIQNGVQTTNNPDAVAQATPPPAPGRGGRGGDSKQPPAAPPKPQGLQINITAMGCAEQFKLGYYNFVRRVRDRRFLVIDRERGLAMVMAAADQPAGKYATYKLSDGREITAGPNRPASITFFETYKIEGGKIRRVEAVQLPVPTE